MSEGVESEQPPSARLAQVQETLRELAARTADVATAAALAGAAQEIGQVRLLLDLPRPGARRAHMRVPEAIGTVVLIDGREVDAAIVDISVGGVGLVIDQRLPAGTHLKVAIPPVGWMEAEVVATAGGRLHLRFRADAATTEQQRALLDLVLRHYE